MTKCGLYPVKSWRKNPSPRETMTIQRRAQSEAQKAGKQLTFSYAANRVEELGVVSSPPSLSLASTRTSPSLSSSSTITTLSLFRDNLVRMSDTPCCGTQGKRQKKTLWAWGGKEEGESGSFISVPCALRITIMMPVLSQSRGKVYSPNDVESNGYLDVHAMMHETKKSNRVMGLLSLKIVLVTTRHCLIIRSVAPIFFKPSKHSLLSVSLRGL